jgi:phenylpropionate dioxygenase-like ring-hydroxylating dioxygenase large terminal subunit
LLVESLLKSSHFPFVHNSYLGNFENAFYPLGTSNGRDSRIMVPLENFEQTRSVDGFNGISIMYHLFPHNFVLFMGTGLLWLTVQPLEIYRCRLVSTLFSYTKESSKAVSSLGLISHILDQDFEILEGQQTNLAYPQRYHFTGHERLIQPLHHNLSKQHS